ncbi:methyltransferase family protein [Sphingomonas oligophenolica]|uniref:Isoprenylcysteine carboxylmethyltransferase family protein n=1 Tax=Sphingomonas oligophenolica TaxID=301154 RepID=A0A502CHW3_9SPHN|nr:isoprenylcysteine carboxylmethyltransferase family protein [Sphingomonas oligophenolica]TPG12403.1 isoprenylcysteine carboxylmethyltransferase family protein [Sphingomonas oligophenolica]
MSGDPVALPGLAVIAVGLLAFLVALLAARRRSGGEQRGNATRSRRSMVGIAVQGVAIMAAAFGPIRVTLDPLSPKALIEAGVSAALMVVTVGLFVWASRAMGRNWSIVARTRDDHQLVDTGPFAYLRHPIYTALFLLMIAFAIAYGHTPRLLLAIPLYALGTWLRISEEERLLRTMFGERYDAYAARVKRFVPGVF